MTDYFAVQTEDTDLMKFFRKLFGREISAAAAPKHGPASVALALGPAPDIVDGINALGAYYRLLEAQAYERGLKTVRERRDFRDDLLLRIDDLLEHADDPSACAQIQFEMDKEASFLFARRGDNPSSLDAEARNLDPHGFDVLAPETPLSFDSLKNAYRKAAKVHHPDVGGDNATMQRVNDAYALFSALIRRSEARTDAVEVPPNGASPSVAEFLCDVRFARLTALVDDFNGPTALDAFHTIAVAQHVARFEAAQTLSRLAEILAAASRLEDAREVLATLRQVTDLLNARGMNFGPIFQSAAMAIESPKRRFIFNHMRQADNALRLGIIDAKRHADVAVRVHGTEEHLSEEADAFTSFVRGATFLLLPMDVNPYAVNPKGLVPGPNYYSRVETLSAAQGSEYMRAFHGSAPELAAKYAAVRVDALLRAPFLGFRDIDAVLAEIQTLGTAQGLKSGIQYMCDAARQIVDFLRSLSSTDRARRIQLLMQSDSDPSHGATMTMDATGIHITQPRPILANSQYADFAIGPLERIERFVRTGSEETAEECAVRERAQRAEFDEIRAFNASEVYKRAREAASAKDSDPNGAVSAIVELCDAMYLRIGKVGDRWLELGHWTNQLTITLVKLKRYNETVTWIERFKEAPEAVRARTANSTVSALEKRLERARKSVANP